MKIKHFVAALLAALSVSTASASWITQINSNTENRLDLTLTWDSNGTFSWTPFLNNSYWSTKMIGASNVSEGSFSFSVFADHSNSVPAKFEYFTSFSDLLGSEVNLTTSKTLSNGYQYLFDLHSSGAENKTLTAHLVGLAPVPEPETYAMFLAGLGLMGFMSRRRRIK